MLSDLRGLINGQINDLNSQQSEFNKQREQEQSSCSAGICRSSSPLSAPLTYTINIEIEGLDGIVSLNVSDTNEVIVIDKAENQVNKIIEDPFFNLDTLKTLDLDGDDALDLNITTEAFVLVANNEVVESYTTNIANLEIPFDEFVEEEFFPDSVRSNRIIEAEDLNLENYVVEDFSEINTVDETETPDSLGISLIDVPEETGTASLLAEDYNLAGIYDLTIGYYDENDGEATIEILINDEVVEELLLDENTISGYPTADNFRLHTIEGLAILPSDIITFQGTINEGEWARIDNISFISDV